MKNRIGNLIEIDWLNDLHDLQPDGVKLPYNYGHLKNSLIKFGFALPFAVWNDGEKYLCIDGHTRKQVLTELMSEGHDVPKLLKAFEVEAADKKEAIEILVQVYNQKHNPFNSEILDEWLEIEDVEVSMEGVNVNIENVYNSDIDLDSFFEEDNSEKINKNKIVLEYTDEEFEMVNEALKNHTGSKEQIFFKLLGL